MVRSVQIQLGSQDGEWRKASLRRLSSDVITDDEAGQRGEKFSKMIQMLADAYIANATETTRLMQEIKHIVLP